MKYTIYNENGIPIAIIEENEFFINDIQDAIDLIGNLFFEGINHFILFENQITPEFFNLKSGIAGEILQKFTTYNIKLAVVGNFDKFQSKSLNDFIFESNKRKQIIFVETEKEAIDFLSKF